MWAKSNFSLLSSGKLTISTITTIYCDEPDVGAQKSVLNATLEGVNGPLRISDILRYRRNDLALFYALIPNEQQTENGGTHREKAQKISIRLTSSFLPEERYLNI